MRGKWTASLAAFILGAMVVAAVPVVAGQGDPILAGKKNNARRVTKLIGRHGLEIRASKSEALKLYTQPGVPPMTVNQTKRVINLNADQLDGYDAIDLISDWDWVDNHVIPNDTEWSLSKKQITVRSPNGALVMSGTVDFYNNSASGDSVQCWFEVDDTVVLASLMEFYVGPFQWGTCSSTAMVPKNVGTYDVEFVTDGMSATSLEADNGYWWAFSLSQ